MTQVKWFLFSCSVFAALFVSTFASAQDVHLVSRVREVEANGQSYYRLRAMALEPFSHLIELSAPGTTPEQIDALNPYHVNYRCVVDGRSIVPPTRNGRLLEDGSIANVMDYATFCPEGEPRRELVVGMSYLLPREIVRTPSERLGDITTRISEASQAERGTVIEETGDAVEALIHQGVPPTTIVAYTAALRSRVLVASIATSTDMTFEAPEADAPPATDAAELAALRSQVERLTQERDEARGALDGRWPWWVVALLALIGLTIAFLFGYRSVPRIRLEDEDASSEPMVPKRELDAAYKALEEALERAKTADKSVENLRLRQEAFKGLTPASLKEEREQAKLFRMMREEWQTTPGVDPAFTMNARSVAKTLAAWLRLDALQMAWGGMTPVFVPADNVPDGGLQAYVDDWIGTLIKQRDGFERKFDEVRKEREGVLSNLREQFGALVSLESGVMFVDEEKLREEFRLRKDQNASPILGFLQPIYETAHATFAELGWLLERRERDDLSPVPGSIPIPRVPAEANDLASLWEDEDLDDTAEVTPHSNASESPINGEKTRFVNNPFHEAGLLGFASDPGELKFERTQPMAKIPAEIEELDKARVPRPSDGE